MNRRLSDKSCINFHLPHPKIKKCAAEATHRKMHSSNCCDTISSIPVKQHTRKEHAPLPIVKVYVFIQGFIKLCRSLIITYIQFFVNIFFDFRRKFGEKQNRDIDPGSIFYNAYSASLNSSPADTSSPNIFEGTSQSSVRRQISRASIYACESVSIVCP